MMFKKAIALTAPTLCGLAFAFAPVQAEAYSVKVHIHIANEVRAEMMRNWNGEGCTVAEDDWCGVPAVKLLGPDGTNQRYVVVDRENAEAIRDNPEFWRGGAIGPDNTVFPGMTDPSHGWQFAPFSQCQSLLDNAEDGAERAYALGCFLHGITDNNAHHVVNYFSGETFTLFPKDAAKDGELSFSLLNVVRHMTVEGKIEKALEASNPDGFTNEKMRHKIARGLYRRVYLDPHDEGRGLWHWFAGQLVARKNDALMAAHLDGFDPNDHLELSIEDIKEQGLTIDLDRRVMDAYVEFLKTGGTIDGLTPGEIPPADYVLLLPEILEDIKRLLDIAEARGVQRTEEIVAQWRADGECTILCPIVFSKKKLFEHLFAERSGGERSRFGEAVDLKKAELDAVLDGYLESVERLSNLVVTKGVGGLGLGDVAFAIEPLNHAIDQVTDFPYQVLFPEWAVDVIENVVGLREFLEGTIHLVKEEIKAQITARMSAYTNALREQLLALAPAAIQHIHEQAQELLDIAKAQLDEAKLQAIGLDLTEADALLGSFGTSVMYMNSFNSVAGALANTEVVFSTAPTSFFGGGPLSFDASFQVGYTQLSVCENLAEAFYPCGTSAVESLQPDFRKCQKIEEITAEMNPNVECHDGSATEFVSDPNPAQCVRRGLPDIIDFHEGHLGSYTLAHPPELADRGPECVAPVVPGITADDKEDDVGAGEGEGDDAEGCACSTSSTAPPAWWLLLALPAIRRRRRRS